MKLKIDKKDCLLEELIVPKGYRIIEDWELLRELRTNKELQEIFKKGIWVNRMMGIRAAWRDYFNIDASFLANEPDVGYHLGLRGVWVKL